MKRPPTRVVILLLTVLAAAGGGLYYYWRSQDREAPRYPSVSSRPIELGTPLAAPEKGVVLPKPEPRIR